MYLKSPLEMKYRSIHLLSMTTYFTMQGVQLTKGRGHILGKLPVRRKAISSPLV